MRWEIISLGVNKNFVARGLNHSGNTRKLNEEGNAYPLAIPMANIVNTKIYFEIQRNLN